MNLALLCDFIHNDGSINVKYVNMKQQCADLFTKGFTNAESWSSLLSIVALFGMRVHTAKKIEGHKSCVVKSKREGRIAREAQAIVDHLRAHV